MRDFLMVGTPIELILLFCWESLTRVDCWLLSFGDVTHAKALPLELRDTENRRKENDHQRRKKVILIGRVNEEMGY